MNSTSENRTLNDEIDYLKDETKALKGKKIPKALKQKRQSVIDADLKAYEEELESLQNERDSYVSEFNKEFNLKVDVLEYGI